MFPLTPAQLPPETPIPVPIYDVASSGRTPVLEAAGRRVTLDPASLSSTDLERLGSVRAEEWTLRGLIAVPSDWLMDRITELATADTPRPLGAEVDGAWYFLSPVHTVPTIEEEHVIVGLYR